MLQLKTSVYKFTVYIYLFLIFLGVFIMNSQNHSQSYIAIMILLMAFICSPIIISTAIYAKGIIIYKKSNIYIAWAWSFFIIPATLIGIKLSTLNNYYPFYIFTILFLLLPLIFCMFDSKTIKYGFITFFLHLLFFIFLWICILTIPI